MGKKAYPIGLIYQFVFLFFFLYLTCRRFEAIKGNQYRQQEPAKIFKLHLRYVLGIINYSLFLTMVNK